VTLIAGSLFGRFFPKPAEERVSGFALEPGEISVLGQAQSSARNE